MTSRFTAAVFVCIALAAPLWAEDESKDDQAAEDRVPVPAVLDFELTTLDGETTRLAKYHGKVILLVNVASKCGLTPQYEPLQQLHEKYAEPGLVVLGVPANDFGKQEPGSNEQIKQFCETKFGVGFDMLAKVSVKGERMTPLYQYLTSEETNPDFAGPIKWNFTKFLISREGKVIARFEPRLTPDSKKVIEAIEAALEQAVPDALCAEAIAANQAAEEEDADD